MGEMVYTVPEVAELLKVNPRTIYKQIDAGKIKYIKLGKVFRIPKKYLDEFILGLQ